MQALSLVDGLITKIDAVEQKSNADSGITIGYWNIRGLADFLRLMLYYKGVNYKEKMYDKEEEWQKDKYNLNLDFPNLPYLFDTKKDIRMTESYAIGMYHYYSLLRHHINHHNNNKFRKISFKEI